MDTSTHSLDSFIRGISQRNVSKIEGVWDRSSQPLSLGGLLTFMAELDVLQRISGGARCVLVMRHGRAAASPANPLSVPNWVEALVAACPSIDELQWEHCEQKERTQYRGDITAGRTLQWPAMDMRDSYVYGSLRPLQRLHVIHAESPRLPLRPRVISAASAILERVRSGLPIIAVHLKNTAPGTRAESNADFAAWGSMFDSLRSRATFNAQ